MAVNSQFERVETVVIADDIVNLFGLDASGHYDVVIEQAFVIPSVSLITSPDGPMTSETPRGLCSRGFDRPPSRAIGRLGL